MGRPPTRPKRLKDGFYIEVRSKGMNSGMKIRSDTREEMQKAADFYSRNKEVVVLGEHKDDIWMNEKAEADKLKLEKKQEKAKVRELLLQEKKEQKKEQKEQKQPKAKKEKKAPKAEKPKKAVKAKKAKKK